MNPNDFDVDYKWSEKISESIEIEELYEKKLNSKIIQRIKITNRKQQKAGYDIELILFDGRRLTIEEKIRSKFFPDLLLEIKHENGKKKIGWLYKSEAEVLSYIQPTDKEYILTLWKLKDLAQWSKTKEFFQLINDEKIKEIWSSSIRNNREWRTENYAIPFHILKDKNFEYKNKDFEKNKSNLPLEFFSKKGDNNE